ncbi:MAG: Shikimate dehydrogenase substrate binding protein [Frondihabitans sp.]|nr:Shikimate dehydrogenase substrate binding protein [Frondihabitans sp.]
MGTVQDVITELDTERERIWLTLPEDVRDLGNGIIPRFTGPKKQYFTSLLYAEGEARTLADEIYWGLIEVTHKPNADLDTLKMIVTQIVDYKADFFDFVGLPLTCKWTHRYAEGARAAETLEEFAAVTGAALSYMNRVHMWIQSVFPWGIATAFPRADARQTA